MKKLISLILIGVFIVLPLKQFVLAADADFSDSILLRSKAYPNYIQLYNVDVSGDYYFGTFKWDSTTNTFKTVGGELEATEDFQIPFRSIIIDGNMNDWNNISPVIIDARGDDNDVFPGNDIERVFIAKDNNFMYFGVTVVDGYPMSAGGGGLHFEFAISRSIEVFKLENHFVLYTSANYSPDEGWGVSTNLHLPQPVEATELYYYGPSYVAVGHIVGSEYFVEWKVPITHCLVTHGKFPNSWSHYYSLEGFDWAESPLRLK